MNKLKNKLNENRNDVWWIVTVDNQRIIKIQE